MIEAALFLYLFLSKLGINGKCQPYKHSNGAGIVYLPQNGNEIGD